jgi:hypothetical protein
MIGKAKRAATFGGGYAYVIDRVARRVLAQPGVRMKGTDAHAFTIPRAPRSLQYQARYLTLSPVFALIIPSLIKSG